jgi:plastocyanin
MAAVASQSSLWRIALHYREFSTFIYRILETHVMNERNIMSNVCQPISLNKGGIVAGAIASFITAAMIIVTAPNMVYAQTGSMATLQNIQATYAVSIIPGAAQRESPYHYYPSVIAIPTGTTIAWFNNDFGQPHTVTSGAPGASDVGSLFNSGIMPATANSFFQYIFDEAGEALYHCEIHPWRVASVSVSDASERRNNFELTSGAGPVLNLAQHSRVLLNFKPLTVPLDRTTPLNYNVTMTNSTGTVFSETFVTSGESLPLELVSSNTNKTITYGPDFSSTGTYHVEGPILAGNEEYIIAVEISAINARPPENPIRDEFSLRTVMNE